MSTIVFLGSSLPVLINTSSSGNAYTVTLSDSVASTDSLQLTRSLYVTVSDTLISSDTLIKAVGATLSLSDSVSSSDANNEASAQTLQDSVTASDTLQQVRDYYRAYVDALSTSDSLTRQLASVLAFADPVTVTDSLTAEKVSVYAINLADSVSVTDAIAGLQRIFSVWLGDSVGLADGISTSGGTVLHPIVGNISLWASLDNQLTYIASLDNGLAFLASLDNQLFFTAGVNPMSADNPMQSIDEFGYYTLTYTYSGDLTGCTLEFVLQPNVASNTAFIKKTSGSGITVSSTSSTQSVYVVTLTNTDMANVGPGTYYTQSNVVDSLGNWSPISKAMLQVKQTTKN